MNTPLSLSLSVSVYIYISISISILPHNLTVTLIKSSSMYLSILLLYYLMYFSFRPSSHNILYMEYLWYKQQQPFFLDFVWSSSGYKVSRL